MSASESRSVLVLELAEEFLERYRQGQRPSLKEYMDRYPELATEIKEVFPAMAMMENVALADNSLAGATIEVASALRETPPRQLGDFRILREVGRGGMGIVYEAEQMSLGRHVALKVLPRKVLLDAQQKRRFEREAKAAAKLHHTNIVPVFGVGEHDGLPYYVMQFIQGLGLDEVCHELKRMRSHPQARNASGEGFRAARKDVSAAEVARSLMTGVFPTTPDTAIRPPDESEAEDDDGKSVDAFMLSASAVTLPGSDPSHGRVKKSTFWQSIARVGVQVADALDYAHKQGIQHRDVKPSNLLLDTTGTVWVTDFGLARAENEDHLTHPGDIVGTLRYMPPEAFEGRADARSDLYSLGLTIYELLVLRPAFEEKVRHKLIKRVMTEEPARLDKLNRSIPHDLVTIVHKAIDREPAHRYQTAGELATDLQRFLDDEPIQARQIANSERLLRWCRHHPGVAMLTATLTLLLVAVTVASLFAAARFDRLAKQQEQLAEQEKQTAAKEYEARRAAEKAKKSEAAQRQRAEIALYYSRIALAERAWQANNVRAAEHLLDLAVQSPSREDRRDWEWCYLKNLCHADLLTLSGHEKGQPYSVAYSPDGRFLASAARAYSGYRRGQTAPSEVIIWDTRTGQRLRSLDSSAAIWPVAVVYSLDGNYLAVLANRPKIAPPANAPRQVDGNYLALHFDKPYKVWDTRSWAEVAPTAVQNVAFRRQTPLRIWIDKDVIRLAKAPGEKPETLRGHIGHINNVDVDPQGNRLASAGVDQTVRVWDVKGGTPLAIFRGHVNAVDAVAFSPDGSRLASASVDGTIKIWDLRRDPRGLRLPATNNGRQSEWLATFAFSSDNQRIHALSCDGPGPCLRTLDAIDGRFIDRCNLSSLNVNLQFNPYVYFNTAFILISSGDRAAGPRRGERNALSVCDCATGREMTVLRGHHDVITAAAFSPDGRSLATASPSDGEVKIWDAVTGQEIVRLWQPPAGPLFSARSLAFSSDGKRLAAGPWGEGSPTGIWIWDAASGQRLAVFEPQVQTISCLTFSGDGTKLAAVLPDCEVRVLEAATGKPLFAAPAPSGLEWAAFSPDGRRLAGAGRHELVHLWDADTGQDVLALPHLADPPPGNYSFVSHIAFSPDGRRLAAKNWDGTISVWSAEELTQRRAMSH